MPKEVTVGIAVLLISFLAAEPKTIVSTYGTAIATNKDGVSLSVDYFGEDTASGGFVGGQPARIKCVRFDVSIKNNGTKPVDYRPYIEMLRKGYHVRDGKGKKIDRLASGGPSLDGKSLKGDVLKPGSVIVEQFKVPVPGADVEELVIEIRGSGVLFRFPRSSWLTESERQKRIAEEKRLQK